MGKVIFDTNIYLTSIELVEEYLKEGNVIIIPFVVLKELDKHKYNQNLGLIARNAIRKITQLKNSFPNQIIFDNEELNVNGDNLLENINKVISHFTLNGINNDLKILTAAKKHKAKVITKDISMSLIAENFGVEIELISGDYREEELFNPYVYIKINKSLKNLFKNIQNPFQNIYKVEGEIYKNIKNILKVNPEYAGWRYFLLYDNDENNIKYVYGLNPIKMELIRIDNLKESQNIKTIYSEIKALDIYQKIAIWTLKNAPNVLILGKYGTGKTLLATAYALSQIDDNDWKKAFISRPNIGLDSRYDIGYLPGDKNEKLIEWLSGFLSSMYQIIGDTRGQSKDRISYDSVKEDLFWRYFEVIPINMIQGLSVNENTLFMVDEIQLINISYMTMILSRLNKAAKLILTGDLKQNYDVIKPSENGLLKLLKVLNYSPKKLAVNNVDKDIKKYLAVVDLKYSHRSELSQIADLLI